MVGGDPLVAGVEGDELGAERSGGICGHGREESPVLGDRQHQADRLHHPARRQLRQRARHGGNEVLHVQEAANGVLVEHHGRQSGALQAATAVALTRSSTSSNCSTWADVKSPSGPLGETSVNGDS